MSLAIIKDCTVGHFRLCEGLRPPVSVSYTFLEVGRIDPETVSMPGWFSQSINSRAGGGTRLSPPPLALFLPDDTTSAMGISLEL